MHARVVFLWLLAATATGTATTRNDLYWGNTCTGTPYEYDLGICQRFRTISFTVVPRERQACLEGVSMLVRYYNSSTTCGGEASATAVVHDGTCTAIGEISIQAELAGLPTAVKCEIIDAMATVPTGSISVAAYTDSSTCGGSCSVCQNIPMGELSVTLKDCEGCCPNDEGPGYKKSYTSCVNTNGANVVVIAEQKFSDAACTAGAGTEELHYTDGRCVATDYGSLQYTLSNAQPFCNVVYLMGKYGFNTGSLLSQAEFAQKVPYAASAITASDPITIDFKEAASTTAVSTALLAIVLAALL